MQLITSARLEQRAEWRPLSGCQAATGNVFSRNRCCINPSVFARCPDLPLICPRANTTTEQLPCLSTVCRVEARLDRSPKGRSLRIALFQVLTLSSLPLFTRVACSEEL